MSEFAPEGTGPSISLDTTQNGLRQGASFRALTFSHSRSLFLSFSRFFYPNHSSKKSLKTML